MAKNNTPVGLTSQTTYLHEMLPLQQAAEEAACSVSTLRNLIARGDLTAYRFGPRMIRIRRQDLEALLQPYQGGQAGSWNHL